MDVKEAVRTAKEYIAELFDSEEITFVGLEEVVYSEESDSWNVTIGFSRPWNNRNAIVHSGSDFRTVRSFKVLRINNSSGSVESLTDRILSGSL